MGDQPPEEASRDGNSLPSLTFPVVGIGASAGGLEAASQLLRQLPDDLGMALVLVQHLDPTHASSLVELLSRVAPMPVCEAEEGQRLAPDRVYVIPPNAGMVLRHGSLHLTPRGETREPHRPIDLFLQSLATDRGSRSIGVILSGTGTDGTVGLAAVRDRGGITLAQDVTATYGGMPESAVAAGCVDYVLPVEGLAAELVRISRHSSVQGLQPDALGPRAAVELDQSYDAVVQQLCEASGVDFSNYKQATIRRRIQRRMVFRQLKRVEQYLALLRADPEELVALRRDVLISVTSFFRDPPVFEALQRLVFPALLQDRPPRSPIRVWVPGCATGEEVYSIAICLLEFLGPRAADIGIKLFGTDVSQEVIDRARQGRFPERIAEDVGPERLRRFFVKDEGGFVICKAARDLCVFARQDATRDPPFSNLDLISCRNVLIYLGPNLQSRVLPVFHYALREGGFLLLGTSETVGRMDDHFSPVERKLRVYRRKPIASRLVLEAMRARGGGPVPGTSAAQVVPAVSDGDFQREADRVLLARCAPPGVLVDETLEILQFRGSTGLFLAPAPGTPTNDLLRMARKGLLPDLRDAIEEARSKNATARRDGLHVETNGHHIETGVEVVPISVPYTSRRCYLILFREAMHAPEPAAPTWDPSEDAPDPNGAGRRIAQLEQELAGLHDYLRVTLEERSAVHEELQAANEELLSSNEEMQSTNEELQTTQEELQATNEELLTVNEELQQRNEEASLLGNDLTNLLTSVEIPIIMLGRDLRIRRFTPSAGKVLNLIPTDVDRSILDLKPKIDVPDLEAMILEVLDTFLVKTRDVQDHEGHWYSLCVRPYRSQDNKVDGAVLTLSDVDATKRAADRISEARDYAENIVNTVREPLLVLDRRLQVKSANDAFRETFRVVPARIGTPESGRADVGAWVIPALQIALEEVWQGGSSFDAFEAEAELPGLGRRTVRANARRIHAVGDEEALILLVVEDVTDQRRVEEERQVLAQKLQEAQRLKSLGMLAGGIAHDFNNILTAILGYTSTVRAELPVDSGLLPQLTNIEQAADRAADLCSQMLAYAGRGRFVIQRLDLSALVHDFAPLLRASVSKKAVLHLELAADLPAICVDAAQLRQVALNLVINASEAVGGTGGNVTLRTGLSRPSPEYWETVRLAPEAPQADYVFLEITDDGCGMDAETRAHVFDPFFSRKFPGRGLGLAAAIGIVRSHHGALKLDSEPDRGSTFRVLFPAVAGPIEKVAVPKPEETAWSGKGTVLVVDDEDIVRNLVRHMLEGLGLHVLEASDGRAGVEVFRAKADEIDVVMLDLTMPHLDGAEAFGEMRRLRPDARVVLMSGYDERESMRAFTAPGLIGFLRKPFRLSDLRAKLRHALEGE